MIEPALAALLDYAGDRGLLDQDDRAYVRNRILEVLRVGDYDPELEAAATGLSSAPGIDELLKPLLDDAAAQGLISPDTRNQRDLWDTAIMGCFVSEPSRVSESFWAAHSSDPRAATDAFHALSVASNYIRVGRTDVNPQWLHQTRYGEFEITINISKPEKDPRDIAAAAASNRAPSGYPLCLLCRENEGYAGRSDHPARQNLRLIPMQLSGELWFLQYSPYRYYNEHCIVLSNEHRPMAINDETFARLADFAELFPHYLIGSNADLPIVGGSILNHDHFQGGRHEFPMDRARPLTHWRSGGLSVEILDWPLAVIRVSGSRDLVLEMSSRALAAWRNYDDPEHGVISYSGETPHNTITPIVRTTRDLLRCDLVLRNNRTSAEHPDGIFHPHAEIHPIKRENIGLIEVLGLAVLPGRLATELEVIAACLATGGPLPPELSAHSPMLDGLRESAAAPQPGAAFDAVRQAAGDYFVRGLEHCGVFGPDNVAGTSRFLRSTGLGVR